MKKRTPTEKPRFDNPWKKVLNLYFKNFMAYCCPEQYALIDWTKGVRMLDKELLKIDKEAALGDGHVDKLIEIYCLDGALSYLILHLEIQRDFQSHFEKRMFQYRYRLMDLYDKPIASLAVLIDANPTWRPTRYRQEVWGSSVEINFPIIKLTDYQDRIAELTQSTNPFAHVILAQLALNKKQGPEDRLETKFTLTRNLYKLGWVAQDIRALYKFIDWVIALPPELDLIYHDKVLKIEEELAVHYVTTAERIGIQKGIEIGVGQGIEQGIEIGVGQGVHKGEFSVVLHLLQKKFGTIPDRYKEKITQMPSDALLELAGEIFYSQSLDELFKH